MNEKLSTSEKADALIKKLGGIKHWKMHTCGKLTGCTGCEKEQMETVVPIMIGDVLEKLGDRALSYYNSPEKDRLSANLRALWDFWKPAGFSKPLQDLKKEKELIDFLYDLFLNN